MISNKQRPSNIEAELCRISTAEAPSILGQIHFDLAKYHEVRQRRTVAETPQCRTGMDSWWDGDGCIFIANPQDTLSTRYSLLIYPWCGHDILRAVVSKKRLVISFTRTYQKQLERYVVASGCQLV